MTKFEQQIMHHIAQQHGVVGIIAFLAKWSERDGVAHGGLSWIKERVSFIDQSQVDQRFPDGLDKP